MSSPNAGHCLGSTWRRLRAAIVVAHVASLVGCTTLGIPSPLSGARTQQTPTTATSGVSDSTPSTSETARDLHHRYDSVANDSNVVSVGYDEPIAQAGFSRAIRSTAACSANCQDGCNYCGGPEAAPHKNAEEYIFDGGDQQPSVVIQKDWSAAGVDPTDTVIYYETLAGTVCVRPSNRVPIYAPRFGSVRQVSGLQLSARAVGTERILVPVTPGGLDELNMAGTVALPVAPHGEEQVRLIDAFQENNRGTPIAQTLPPMRMSEARVPSEYVELFGTGLLTEEEIAVIGRFLQNARTWSTPESLAVIIDGQAAALARDTLAAQDVYVYELPDKCAMRICKAASHTIANSGDIVSFTIRFDNAGVKPLGNAVIVDSLSPRLEYIEGSQQCSVGARFSALPNDVGSMVLQWELESAVEPSQGGVISFDCRVR
jgi:uncharacterized repeat protein (TIGR01451 family)